MRTADWFECMQMSIERSVMSDVPDASDTGRPDFDNLTDNVSCGWHNQRVEFNIICTTDTISIICTASVWSWVVSLIVDLLLCDATHSAVMRLHVVCPSVRPSVCLSVTFRYRDHIRWNSSKIISLPNSLRLMSLLTPTWAIWCNGNTPKIRMEEGWGQEHIKAEKSPKRCKIGPRLLSRTNRKSHIHASIDTKINDLGWPLTAETSLLQK